MKRRLRGASPKSRELASSVRVLARWGREADPEPRIIRLLSALRHHIEPFRERILEQDRYNNSAADLRELDQILADWQTFEAAERLRALIRMPRGVRRTQQAVSREKELVCALLNHAIKGRDVHTFRRAADALGPVRQLGDKEDLEKRIERVWKQWGQVYTAVIRAIAAGAWSIKAFDAKQASAIMKRLPSLDIK